MNSSWRFPVAALVLGMMHGMSMAAPSRAERQQWLALSNYLQLSSEQLQAMVAQRTALEADIQAMNRQAQAFGAAAQNPSAVGAQDLVALCQRAQQRVASHRQGLQGLLSAAQLERLQQLERAFALMPLIEAAQSAALISDRLAVSPPGLPAGAVEVEQVWLRSPAPPWPGCQGTRVVRELDRPDNDGPRKPAR